jgi:flagellar motor switch protein FliG
LQRVIRETAQHDLALALAGADGEVRQAVLDNVSQRQAAAIEEDLEALGAFRLRDVEAAQRRMAARARRLLGGDSPAASEGWAVA